MAIVRTDLEVVEQKKDHRDQEALVELRQVLIAIVPKAPKQPQRKIPALLLKT